MQKNLFKLFLTLSCLSFSSSTFASSIQFEGTSTTSFFNYFQIPNNDANRVNLPDITATRYRLTAFIDVTDSTSLYFLYAPLIIDYNLQSGSAFEFDGVNFQAGTNTDVTYKFNSYRIGYLWRFGSDNFKYWIGPILKIRDAKITVAQGGTSKTFDNVGPVPLLGAGFEYKLFSLLSLYIHIDGLAAPQGSAYDGAIELRISLFAPFSLAVGARVLGGGADNDKLATFAQFNSYTASLILEF